MSEHKHDFNGPQDTPNVLVCRECGHHAPITERRKGERRVRWGTHDDRHSTYGTGRPRTGNDRREG